MSDWLDYQLQDFFSVNAEVFAHLSERQWQALEGWTLYALLVCAALMLLRRHLASVIALAYLWMFCAFTYFFHLLNELVWIGDWLGWLFLLQALILVALLGARLKGLHPLPLALGLRECETLAGTQWQKAGHRLVSLGLIGYLILGATQRQLPGLSPDMTVAFYALWLHCRQPAPVPDTTLQNRVLLSLLQKLIPSFWCLFSMLIWTGLPEAAWMPGLVWMQGFVLLTLWWPFHREAHKKPPTTAAQRP